MIDELKKQLEAATSIEELKQIIQNYSGKLSDEELGSVDGGSAAFSEAVSARLFAITDIDGERLASDDTLSKLLSETDKESLQLSLKSKPADPHKVLL